MAKKKAPVSRFMDFDALETAEAEEEQVPPEFKLGGETFTCLVSPKATAVGRLTKAGDRNIDALIGYLRELIVKEQRVTFDRVIEDDDEIVDIDQLAKIIEWISEVYSARPTK